MIILIGHVFGAVTILALLGVLFEIAGALYLSLAFLFKTPLGIKLEVYGTGSSRLLGGFPAAHNQFNSQYKQIIEARIGFSLAVLGLVVEAGSFLMPADLVPLWATVSVWLIVFAVAESCRRYLLRPQRVQPIRDRRETNGSLWPL